MSTSYMIPTPYSDINAALNRLLSSMQDVLGEQFVGLYLGGSLALGDFDPRRSDIDFIAVTAGELSPETSSDLAEMHARLWATGGYWARKFDGSYVPQQVFRRWTAHAVPCPFVEGDEFTVTTQGSAVIQRHIIREHGVVVAGPSPQTLLDGVAAGELRTALRESLMQWWRSLLDDPCWVRQSRNQPFAILTMCRMLYTLEHGTVVSKPVAARWAKQALDERWTEPIEWALAQPHAPQSDHLAAALGLIRYCLDQYAARQG